MTRQFFRKADAAVVVYDVTNEGSFLNARQWLDSARDAIQLPSDAESAQAEFLLLANKADLADDDVNRYTSNLAFY
jgi:GTPase SAR1 family protein